MGEQVNQNERVAALYRRFGPLIFARCHRMLRDRARAEDATQEVFVRVLKHVASAPDEAQALAWIYRISTNYCLNALRDEGRRASPPALLVELLSEHPEHALANREAANKLVADAPVRVQAALVHYYVDGFDQSRIAELLGVSRRTIINWLNDFGERSRRRLTAEER